MPRLSLELRKAVIHVKEDECSTAEIQETLEKMPNPKCESSMIKTVKEDSC